MEFEADGASVRGTSPTELGRITRLVDRRVLAECATLLLRYAPKCSRNLCRSPAMWRVEKKSVYIECRLYCDYHVPLEGRVPLRDSARLRNLLRILEGS